MMEPMTSRIALLSALTGLVLSACSWGGVDGAEPPVEESTRSASSASSASWDPAVSMTPAGADLAARSALGEDTPSYDVIADVDPASGHVTGTVRLTVPVGEDVAAVHLRYFAGLPDFEAQAEVGPVRVDGADVEATRQHSIVTVPLPPGHAAEVDLVVPFDYTLRPTEPAGLLGSLGGLGGPADVGLLGLHDDVVNLGHWFPLWVADGNDVDPDPAGYGDIGNFPAADIAVQVTVPDGWTVIDGGVRTAEDQAAGKTTVWSEGAGMNDLVVSVVRGYTSKSRTLGGDLEDVTITAWGPKEADGELAGVLDETATSLETLSARFVDYPWREFDVVAAPLGSGVGGMEWPGATWIEASLFAGGLPGLGDLGDLDAVGGLNGWGGDLGGMLESLRLWTIAHEVGHEWWHVVVGNDSVLDPVVDEPLAQYSACLVLREVTGDGADSLCRAHIEAGYEQMRLTGESDAPAARATDEFASGGQYAGVVYGKAASFYFALEEAFGRPAVAATLGSVTEEHAFTLMTADDLHAALRSGLGDGSELDRLWRRWMEGTHGDQDLGVTGSGGSGQDGLEGLEGLEGLSGIDGLEDLQGLDLDELLRGTGQDPDEIEDMLDQLLGGLEQPR